VGGIVFSVLPKVKYDHTTNVVKVGQNRYAVLKYLLARKYFPMANELERQLIVKKLHYVLFNAEEIAADIAEFVKPHVMDGYNYPMCGSEYPNYEEMTPYPQQIHVSRWLIGHDGCGQPINKGRGHHLHSSMRTGKSLSCLWAAVFGLQTGRFTKVLIVSPKTVMVSTWAKELNNHFLDIKYTVKRGVKRDRESHTPIDIINWDGLTAVIENEKVSEYDLIIYDEATAIKTTKTTRWKCLNRYLQPRPDCRLWLVTGTPLAQSPLAAYGPAKLVSPHLVPRSFTAWRAMTMYNQWGHEWHAKADAHEICANALQPCLRFELKDIAEIPDHTYEYIVCEKSKKQEKMFKQMAQDFLATYGADNDGQINAVNAAAKMSKMLQILSGVVYDSERQVIDTDASPRLDALVELIDQLPEDQPVVIFAEWTHTIDMLQKYLKPIYKTVEVIHGATQNNDSPEGRAAIERRVQNKETKVVICHPSTTAFGLDFSSTNVVVWYCVTFKNELYTQGAERIRNYASASRGYDKFIVYHLISDEMEQLYFNALKDKSLMQQGFFDIIKNSLKSEFAV